MSTQLEQRIDSDLADGRRAVHRDRDGRISQHGRGRSLCRRSRVCAETEASGFTWMARTAASQPPCPMCRSDLRALNLADSVAVDPHKWLYAPLEAGCAARARSGGAARCILVSPRLLPLSMNTAPTTSTTALRTPRGFRALKVWLALKHVGADGYRQMIADDMALSRAMAAAVARIPICSLSRRR